MAGEDLGVSQRNDMVTRIAKAAGIPRHISRIRCATPRSPTRSMLG
jgi:hypothetical protein